MLKFVPLKGNVFFLTYSTWRQHIVTWPIFQMYTPLTFCTHTVYDLQLLEQGACVAITLVYWKLMRREKPMRQYIELLLFNMVCLPPTTTPALTEWAEVSIKIKTLLIFFAGCNYCDTHTHFRYRSEKKKQHMDIWSTYSSLNTPLSSKWIFPFFLISSLNTN